MNGHLAPTFAPVAVDVERRPDGTLVLRSPLTLGPIGRAVGDDLARWAHAAPARPFLAERAPDGTWRTVSYSAARARVQRLAQGLLDAGAAPERPVAIVSENSIDHALVALAAMEIGVPVAPISPAYARAGSDPARFADIIAQLTPCVLVIDDRAGYATALAAHPALTVIDDAGALERAPTAAVSNAFAAARPETIAKVLFTSGSTGSPKGVMTSHAMLRANQLGISALWPLHDIEPPVLVDWLPWHHCFGGNFVFYLVLHRGGTLYIDDGKPLPALFDRTLRNLREIAPTAYFGVPRAYALLAPQLERDAALRVHFFSRLRKIFNAGAALHDALWSTLDQLGSTVGGRRVPVVASWGATETAPLATGVHDLAAGSLSIGLPVPGVAIKLAPVDGRYELRVRGPSVMPGYWRNDVATRNAFDEEGYYRTGDAGELIDPARPAAGLRFGGRIAENFKLSSGTWVNSGALRLTLVDAVAPLIIDAVLTGVNADEIGALLFLDVPAARTFVGLPDADLSTLRAHPAIRGRIASGIGALNARSGGTSTRIARAAIIDDMPSRTHGEMTDKGSINQRVALHVRSADADRLHAEPPAAETIFPA